LLFGSIYPHFDFIENGYLFYLFFVVRNNAVQYRLTVKWCHLNLRHYYVHSLCVLLRIDTQLLIPSAL